MKYAKRLLALILSTTIVLCAVPISGIIVNAASIVDSGTYGDNLTWEINSNGTLFFYGEGEIPSVGVINYNTTAGNTNVLITYTNAPWYNASIENVIINEGITAIGKYAFAALYKLTKVSIPSSCTSISSYAFGECIALNEVVFVNDSQLKIIESNAFDRCNKLKKINFETCNALEKIGYYACSGCAIENLVIPDSVKWISDGAFAYCTQLKRVIYKVSELKTCGKEIFLNAGKNASQLVFTFDDNVRVIPGEIFSDFDNRYPCITDLKIGKNVSSIMTKFTTLAKLKTIEVDDDNTFFCATDNMLLDDDKTQIICSTKDRSNCVIPATVKVIKSCAFYGCKELSQILIPNSVRVIESSAFAECSKLTEMLMPMSVAIIGYHAFYNCNSLTKITINNPQCELDSSFITNSKHWVTKPGYWAYHYEGVISGYNNSTAHQYQESRTDYISFVSLGDCFNNYEDQPEINEKLGEYAIASGTLDDFTTTVVLNSSDKPYVSKIIIDGVTYQVEEKIIPETQLKERNGEKFFIALKDNKVEWIGAFDDLFLPFVETSLNYFVYSPDQDKYISPTEKTLHVKVSNSLDGLRFIQAAPGYSQSIFTTNAFKGKLEEHLRTSENGKLRIKQVKLTEGLENNLFEIEQPVINTDKTIGLYETAEFSFKIKTPEKARLSGLEAKSIGSLMLVNVTFWDGTVKKASASEVQIQNYDYRAPEKPWGQDSPEVNANACAAEAAKMLGTMAVTLQGDTSLSLYKLFTQAQLDAIANTILTEVAMYKAPKEKFTESLSPKIIEKVFKCNTKLLVFNSYEIVCTFEASTNWGPVQVQFTCSTSDYALNSNRYAFNGDITYKIISGAEKLPKDIKTEGFAGGLAGANMESFCNAVWSVAQSQLKSAYNTAYGNDLNSAVDIIFGKSVNEILSRTKYGSVSGLYWKLLTTPATSISINCPVDIFVYDSSNQLVASIIHDEINLTTENAVATIENGTKKLQLFDDDYTIEYVPIANGTMNISIERYGFSDGLVDTTEFVEVPLEVTTTFLQDIDNKFSEESDLSLISSNGTVIPVDNYSTVFHDHVSDGVVYHSDVATCAQEGQTWGYCTVCNNYYIMEAQPALEHEFSNWMQTKTATCTESGEETRTCAQCKKTETREIPVKGHVDGDWVVTKPATTAQEGARTLYCTECGEIIRTEVIPKIDEHITLQTITVKTNPNKTTYIVGETLSTGGLVLVAKYSDGSIKDITSGFSCSPTKLTTAGRQTITVTYQGKTTTFVVTVNAPTQGKVKSVSVDNVTMNYKSSITIKPKVDADEWITYTVKYESSNPKVASVDENGNVKALKKGNATITVTVTDQYGNVVKDTCTVTVKYTFIQWIIKIVLFGWIWY